MALKRPAAAMAAPRVVKDAPPVKCLKRPAAAKAAPGAAKKDKPPRAERDGAAMKTMDHSKQIEEVTKLVTQQMSAQLTSEVKAVTALMTQNSEREDKIRSRHELQMEKINQKHAAQLEHERKAWEQERKTHEHDRKVQEKEIKVLQDKLNEANLKRGESDGRLEMLSTIYAEQQSTLALATSAAPPALLDADATASRNGALARSITAPKMRRHGRQAKAQETIAAPNVAEAGEKQASQKEVATPRSARKDAAASLSDVALFGEASENDREWSARNSTRTANKATASHLKSSTPKAATTTVVSPGPPRCVPQPSPIREAFFRSTAAVQSSKPGRPVGSLWGLKPVTPQLVEHA